MKQYYNFVICRLGRPPVKAALRCGLFDEVMVSSVFVLWRAPPPRQAPPSWQPALEPTWGVGTKRMQCGAGGRRDCSARRDPGADRRGCKKNVAPPPVHATCSVTAQLLHSSCLGWSAVADPTP